MYSGVPQPWLLKEANLSPIGRIKILTYLIWGFLGADIFDCIIRSCDLFYWFIRICLGPTVGPAAITSLELFCVLTMCYFSDNVSSKENIKILWLIFIFYYSDIIAIKNSYWFFSFTYEVEWQAKYNLYRYIGCIIYQSNWSGPFSLVVMTPDL